MKEGNIEEVPKMSLSLSMNEILAMLSISTSAEQISVQDLQKQIEKIIVFFAEKMQELEAKIEYLHAKLDEKD